MTAGLYSYFQSKALDRSEFSAYSASYHNLISLQESIGWGHFLCGKISKEWSNLQQDYVSRNSPSTKFDKDKWLRLIIKPLIMDCLGLWTLRNEERHKEKWLRLIIKPLIMDCLDLWTLRNKERHGIDSASKQSKLASQAHRDLRAIYLLSEEVLASDRDLFSKPLDAFFSTTPILFNAGSNHTNPSSTNVAAKPNATPRPTCARYQPTSIRSPATVPTATKTLALFPPLILHSVPQECQTTTATSPPASQQSREPLSKIKSSYVTFSSFPSPFPTLQRKQLLTTSFYMPTP
jgi:hypothetical protein